MPARTPHRSNMQKKLEMAANIAILVVAIAVVGLVVKREFFTKADRGPAPDMVGKKLPLGNIDWAGSNNHLVLALQEDCHFCSESAAFYQRLSGIATQSGCHLIAVLPQEESEGRKYVAGLGLSIGDVRKVSLYELGVDGTPTLILVDNRGTVKRTWPGKLPPEGEAAVIKALQG